MMDNLANRQILLGVTGGIAAYKSAELARQLMRNGASVRAVMTESATRFITPLTLQALTGQPVRCELFDAASEYAMGHIELARWADLVLVAPASANFLARLAQGMADDLLTAICLATSAPVAVAPAMNRQMWDNPATRANSSLLQDRGVLHWGPVSGDQACGEQGLGRMLEPDQLAALAAGTFGSRALAGCHVIVTAGPTREPWDPVRYLTNRSSGKMGFAIAAAAEQCGAQVTLVTGPVSLDTPPRVGRVNVESADDMDRAVQTRLGGCDIFIGAAAVADYRPRAVLAGKIKKQGEQVSLELERTPDVLANVARAVQRPFTVGFAAETHDLQENAVAKLRNKGLDMICANQVGESAVGGFDSDVNALEVYWAQGHRSLPAVSKRVLAQQLLELIAERYHGKTSGKGAGSADRQ